jgi:hypothetical protein
MSVNEASDERQESVPKRLSGGHDPEGRTAGVDVVKGSIEVSVLALTRSEKRALVGLLEDARDLSQQLRSVLEQLERPLRVNRYALAELLDGNRAVIRGET